MERENEMEAEWIKAQIVYAYGYGSIYNTMNDRNTASLQYVYAVTFKGGSGEASVAT